MSVESQLVALTNSTQALLGAVNERKAVLDAAADSASASAAAATNSADAAEDSAVSASLQAVAAGVSASSAAGSASAASASASSALGSANAASASASAAAQSALDAANASRLEVGTVTTGAAGSSAEVEIVGAAGSQVLNLTIPRGDPGATVGAAGSSGQLQFNLAGEFAAVSGSAVDGASLTLGGETVTASKPVLNLSQTWDNAAVAFTGLKFNVTDTASAAESMLLDLQVGGVSRLKIQKNGLLTVVNGIWGAVFGATGAESYYEIQYTGQRRSALQSGGVYFASNGVVSWASSSTSHTTGRDLILARDAANTLAQRNGTNAQAFNLYNTYTDASNYERGFMRWSSNVFEIGSQAAGTGTARDVFINVPAGKGVYFNSTSARDRLYISDDGNDPVINAAGNFWLNLQVGGSNKLCISSTGVYFNGQNAWNAPVLSTNCVGIGGQNASAVLVGGGRLGPASATALYDDATHHDFVVQATNAIASATINPAGWNLVLRGGAGASGSSGAAHGGAVKLAGGAAYGTGTKGRVQIDAPNAAPLDSALANGEITFYLDQSANKLMVRAKYSDGTLKTGEVPLG